MHASRLNRTVRRLALGVIVASTAWLTACGGGGDAGPSCSVADQQIGLRSYMNDWYFWYAVSPNPDPAGYATVDDYFQALLYTGSDPAFPADRWSYRSSTEAFDNFFVQGQTLGYGVMVAGLEVAGQPGQPLYVRYIEPGSPAAAAGLARGDQILGINDQTAAQVIAANDYSALSPTAPGQTVRLSVQNAAGQRQLTLTAAVYALAPVVDTAVVASPGGRSVGYLMVKDMLNQALAPMDAAFAQFKAAGVQDVVIDLRYNGGGLVSTAAALASYPAGPTTTGQVFANLLFNDRHTDSDRTVAFQGLANATGLSRVYVLTGARTCSASEQVINALEPFVDVVTIGDTTCGKPVGFVPVDDGCGNTWSIVNFETVNAQGTGRYFNGLAATCPVAENFASVLGTTSEPLLATALAHADSGSCPAAGVAQTHAHLLGWRPAAQRPRVNEPGDRGGMLLR